MNSARCASTGYSAAYLTFGREMRSPDDAQRDLRSIVEAENFVPEITPSLAMLANTLQEARETHEVAQDKRKEAADKQRRPGENYQVGDLVMIQTHILSNAAKGISSKLSPRRDGPYIVTEKAGPTTYKISTNDKENKPLGTFHTSALEPYIGESEEAPQPANPIRGRGRPRKVQQPVPDSAKPARGRGRPRKRQTT